MVKLHCEAAIRGVLMVIYPELVKLNAGLHMQPELPVGYIGYPMGWGEKKKDD